MTESDEALPMTIKEQLRIETAKLEAAGVPAFLASVQAAGLVSRRQQHDEHRRADALATHCTEA